MTEENTGLLTVQDRSTLRIDGAMEVLSMDDRFVRVNTTLGCVEIEGKDLHMVDLSAESGKMILAGRIDGVFYTEKGVKHLFGKGK